MGNKDICLQEMLQGALLESQSPSLKLSQDVMDNISIRVFWKDIHGLYLGANKVFLEDAHCPSLADLIGKNDYELPWKESEALEFRRDDREVIETGKSKLSIDEPLTRADGSTGWLRTNKFPFKDKKGKIIGVIGTYEDVTEVKEQCEALRKSEAKFKTLFNSTYQFLGILSPDGIVQAVNDTAAQRFSLSPDSLVGSSFQDTPFWLHDAEQREQLILALEKAQQGELVRERFYHQTPGGEKIYVDFSITPVFDEQGKVSMLIPEGRDITAQHIAQKQLKVFNELLEKNVAKRTAELEASNQELSLALSELKQTKEELSLSAKLANFGELAHSLASDLSAPLQDANSSASTLRTSLKMLAQIPPQEAIEQKDLFKRSNESLDELEESLTLALSLIGELKKHS